MLHLAAELVGSSLECFNFGQLESPTSIAVWVKRWMSTEIAKGLQSFCRFSGVQIQSVLFRSMFMYEMEILPARSLVLLSLSGIPLHSYQYLKPMQNLNHMHYSD